MSNPIQMIKYVFKHWSEPAEGYYVSFKEAASYSLGGIGVYTINTLFVSYVTLAANCFLIGSVYGIDPAHLAIMSSIIGIINLVKAPFISMLIDNTNNKHGKFRPFLLFTGIPTAALLIFIPYIPSNFSYSSRCVTIGAAYALLSLFQPLYNTAHQNIGQVMTPNGEERTKLISFSYFICNFGPSLINAILPIFSEFTGGMDSLSTFRIFFPIFSIAGMLLGLWTFFGTKERIIVSKDYVAKISFRDGIKQVAQNKYFWQINMCQVIGALRFGIGIITNWYCVYVLKSNALLGIMNIVIGTASVPGTLLAPILAKNFGKKKILIWSNILHAVFAVFMLFFLHNTVLLFIFLYLSTFSMGAEYISLQAMNADIYDYQQWKTGKRIEGFITQFGAFLIAGFGILTNLILPFFYRHYGLYKNYKVLYNANVHIPLFRILIITTAISSLLSIIPLLFYNLSEKKHAEIIDDLKRRAENELISEESAEGK